MLEERASTFRDETPARITFKSRISDAQRDCYLNPKSVKYEIPMFDGLDAVFVNSFNRAVKNHSLQRAWSIANGDAGGVKPKVRPSSTSLSAEIQENELDSRTNKAATSRENERRDGGG